MLTTLGRITDGLLTRIVPRTTASAGNCKYYSTCGSYCPNAPVRWKYDKVCCPYLSNGTIVYKCETYKQSCACAG